MSIFLKKRFALTPYNLYRCCFIHYTCSNSGKIIPYKLADIGEGIADVQIKEWHVKVGDKVSEFDEICLVQSDKASVTISSRYEGVVDGIAYVGKPLVDIEIEEEEESENTNLEKSDKVQNSGPATISGKGCEENTEHKKILAAPAVRRIIKEHNVDYSTLKGSGRDGRILKEDVLRHLGLIEDNSDNKIDKNVPLGSRTMNIESDKEVPIRGYTRAMIKSMTESLKIPHFGYSDEASHNISLAMDTPAGLAVPNIKDCQQKTILEIAVELQRLLEAGKQQKFNKEDLINGTFTLSNIGAIGGGTYMNPVIMAPQVAIGALGRVQKLPRFDKSGQLQAQSIINVSWAADHRVVDGATMARFSEQLKAYLENPSLMLAELQ